MAEATPVGLATRQMKRKIADVLHDLRQLDRMIDAVLREADKGDPTWQALANATFAVRNLHRSTEAGARHASELLRAVDESIRASKGTGEGDPHDISE